MREPPKVGDEVVFARIVGKAVSPTMQLCLNQSGKVFHLKYRDGTYVVGVQFITRYGKARMASGATVNRTFKPILYLEPGEWEFAESTV